MIITSNKDYDDKELNVRVKKTYNKKNFKIVYLNNLLFSFLRIKNLIRKNKFIYLNSFFDLKWSFFPLILSVLLNKIIILSPRGELSNSVIQNKKFRKKIFIFIFFYVLRLDRHIIFHFTSLEEKRNFKKLVNKKIKCKLIPNVIDLKIKKKQKKLKKKIYKFLFFSRIDEKKNLLETINFFKKIKKNFLFDIFGPSKDKKYLKTCLDAIKDDSRIKFKGKITFEKLIKISNNYHFFILLSKNENFGHSILEASSLNIPLIISKNNPWANDKNLKKLITVLDLKFDKKTLKDLSNIVSLSTANYKKLIINNKKFFTNILNQNNFEKNRYFELFF